MWKWILAIALVGYGAYDWWTDRNTWPEIPVANLESFTAVRGLSPKRPPLQRPVKSGNQRIPFGEYQLAPVARFHAQARVLSTHHFSRGRDSDLAPVDLALGWGPMADSRVLAAFEIWQAGRFYHWRTNNPPIPLREVARSSANMHIIPASLALKRQLEAVETDDVVEFHGLLVNVEGPGGVPMAYFYDTRRLWCRRLRDRIGI